MDEIVNIATSVHAVTGYLLCFDDPKVPRIDLHQLEQPSIETEIGETDRKEEEAADALDALRIEYESLLVAYEEHKRGVEQTIESARCEWLLQESDVLAERLIKVFNDSLEILRADIGRVLAPIVSQQASQISVEDLNDALRAAIAAAEGPINRIEGPKELLEKVSGAIAKRDGPCEIVVTEATDVQVKFVNTWIETRLEDWNRISHGLTE